MNSCARVQGIILTLQPFISHLTPLEQTLAVSLGLAQGCDFVVRLIARNGGLP